MTQAKVRSNHVISHEVVTGEAGGKVIVFKVKDAGELRLEMGKLHVAITERAMLHGLVQRVSDAAAISRDTQTGLAATPQAKFEAMSELVEHYVSGTAEWQLRAKTGGRGTDAGGLLVKALMMVPGYAVKGEEKLREWVSGLGAKQKAALLAHGEIKEAADLIRLDAAEGVDVEGLLGGLLGGDEAGEVK